ncbi:MAG: hypothetical protein WKF91_11390, partial [Segetibacter sp.]
MIKAGAREKLQIPKWLGSTLPALLLVKVWSAQIVIPRIKLNRLSFYPNAPKVETLTGDVSANNFYITSTNLRDTFFTGTLGAEKNQRTQQPKQELTISYQNFIMIRVHVFITLFQLGLCSACKEIITLKGDDIKT